MGQLHRSFRVHTAIATAVFTVYLAVTCSIDLFHTEDCPLTTGKTAPADESCPACRFLAGANSMQASHDSSPAAIQCQIVSAPIPNSPVVMSKQWAGSITLRGPPRFVLS